ncbi:menaquinol oxidoreductase complex Cbc4, cytochrome c subunit, putative, 4 heme-binding sites [Geotalea daltonii FRC-32]|uniref:Menaquinol oxidoreductase complex Cbc4, cytochrome c subunit, putative, 4 heme-binding sites n=1 Tax=Geotalea daltonii (strain DSM 22248 / JCM 15807 / FRC-32) TaxID=316067 RepID=B9M2J7_GEODF|nr:cytochrome c3 family protein [Geotalea daltonii]ACM19376.1 menaquinol oxidoreductase complex Cbc4, cytochrome c subunit, putative, 4 heme-binding sites [Geotalea daltonii FRC-32]
MKNHVWRPLYVALCIVALILIVRVVAVPKDFGVHDRGYMYGWYRLGNEKEWRNFKVKYKTSAYCMSCHSDIYEDLQRSPHARIMCEDCHGPALGHPDDPPTLTINRERKLCLRCHSYLPYKTSGRGKIRGVDPDTHNPEAECVLCHYPHNPVKEGSK